MAPRGRLTLPFPCPRPHADSLSHTIPLGTAQHCRSLKLIPPPSIGLTRAHATLTKASLFLGGGLHAVAPSPHAPASPPPIAGPLRAKVIGNGLRELDRFLSVMIDEVARLIAPIAIDPARFADLRNTANKLRLIRALMGLPSPDHGRLRAIGRSRDCLFHCVGIVRRGDRRHDRRMTAGWPPSDGSEHAPGLILAIGEPLIIVPVDLARICRFYDRLADDLAIATARHLRRH